LREFDGDGDEAVLQRFAEALRQLPDGEAYDAPRQSLRDALIQAREAVHELTSLGDPDAFDPQRIGVLEERAAVLQQIARKYGGTLDAALSVKTELLHRLEELTQSESRRSGFDQELRDLEAREKQLAEQARRDREIACSALTHAVASQLSRVAMENATLRFVSDGDDGSDVQILFAPNPGLGEGPLSMLASGGELSRVLLAISLETADRDVVAIFDEIDAGLGGQVAQQIGECLAEVGRHQQVLAITHLASVAAKADHHFVIEKTVRDGVTRTAVHSLTRDQRVLEIARMLAGDERTEESRALAQQLLENSF